MRVIQPLLKTINFKIISALLLFFLVFLGANNSFADRVYAVQAKDFLGKIVRKNYPDNNDVSKEQIMVAILRANPDAFRGGNIHFLKKVDSLILPSEDIVALIPHAESVRTINEHYKFFQLKKTGKFPRIALPTLPQEVSRVAVDISPENVPSENKEERNSSDSEGISIPEEVSKPEDDTSIDGVVENEDFSPQDHDLKKDVSVLDQAAESKKNRITELEHKKEEQDLTLDQLDSKIRDLEDKISREIPSSTVERITTSLDDGETLSEKDSLPALEEETPAPANIVESNGKDTKPDSHDYISRFLEKKSNLLFLLLPLLALVGLLFWRRERHLSSIGSQDVSVKNNVTSNEEGLTNTESSAYSEQDAAIKIDMARAYQDMGYSDAAKEILEEVLHEGSAQQKEMAQALLAVL